MVALAERLAALVPENALVVSDNPGLAYLARRRTPGAARRHRPAPLRNRLAYERRRFRDDRPSCVVAVVAARAFLNRGPHCLQVWKALRGRRASRTRQAGSTSSRKGAVSARAPTRPLPRLARVKPPKILAVASAVDLDFRYGCTPAWWQLWKGMYEAGVDLVVTPYRGRPVESPWWRTAPNPTYREGESYAAVRDGLARLKGDRYLRRAEDSPGRERARQAHARDDLAGRHAALAPAPRAARRAGAPGRGRLLHGADGALPRDPDGAARAVRDPRRLLRRRRADEPAGVRRHGHGLQLLPRCRSVRVRPRALELGGRAAAPARARRPPGRGGLLGRRPRVLRAAAGREGDGRVLLRLRRQVPPGVDGGDGRRAEPGRARDRLRARRPGLPRRHGQRAGDRRRARSTSSRARSRRRGSTST